MILNKCRGFTKKGNTASGPKASICHAECKAKFNQQDLVLTRL